MGMFAWLGLTRDAAAATVVDPVAPPRRDTPQLTERSMAAVPAAFRALQVLTTAAGQLTYDASKAGHPIHPTALVRRPDANLTRSEWTESVVLSLAVTGNAWLHLDKQGNAVVWDPHRVAPSTDAADRPMWSYGGRDYTAAEVRHLAMNRLPGQRLGLGPLEAARRGLTFSNAAAEYAAEWFTLGGQPSGILSSEKTITHKQAGEYRDVWNGLDPETGEPLDQHRNPSRIKVLGQGLDYTPVMLKPADALWLEAQAATVTDVARVFGIPSSLMLIGIPGASTTYANVSQEWLAFVRFTLMAYIRKIEDALSDLSPAGQTVRANLEGLLRADTKSRYEAHALAIDAGWLTPAEVRDIEGLDPKETTHGRP